MNIFPQEIIEVLEHRTVELDKKTLALFRDSPRDIVKIKISEFGWFGKLVKSEERLVWSYTDCTWFKDVKTGEELGWRRSNLIRKQALLPERWVTNFKEEEQEK